MSLLLDALRKAQDTRDRERGVSPVAQARDAVEPARTAPPPTAPARKPRDAARISPVFAAALAIAIFVGVVGVWHFQPWQPPSMIHIDPTRLKLDTHFDPAGNAVAAPPSPGAPRS